METFVLYLDVEVDSIPDCGDYDVRMLDSSTIEVDLHQGQSLNELYHKLSICNINVISMKNKSNRLEQLFINMLRNGKQNKLKSEAQV